MSFTGQDICLRQALKRNSSEESYSNPKKDTDSDSDSSVEFNPKRIAASTKQVQSFHKLYSPNNKTKLASAEEQILYYKSLMKKHRSELYVIKAENVSCNICQQTLSSKGTNASNAISKHEITSKHSFYFQKWLKKQSEILQICQENDIRMEKLNKAYKKILFMLNVCFSNCGIEEMSPLNVLVSEFNQIEIMNIKESEMIISMIYEVCKDRVNRDLLNKEFVMTVKEFKDKGKSFVIIGAYFKNKAFANVHKVLHFESLINNSEETIKNIIINTLADWNLYYNQILSIFFINEQSTQKVLTQQKNLYNYFKSQNISLLYIVNYKEAMSNAIKHAMKSLSINIMETNDIISNYVFPDLIDDFVSNNKSTIQTSFDVNERVILDWDQIKNIKDAIFSHQINAREKVYLILSNFFKNFAPIVYDVLGNEEDESQNYTAVLSILTHVILVVENRKNHQQFGFCTENLLNELPIELQNILRKEMLSFYSEFINFFNDFIHSLKQLILMEKFNDPEVLTINDLKQLNNSFRTNFSIESLINELTILKYNGNNLFLAKEFIPSIFSFYIKSTSIPSNFEFIQNTLNYSKSIFTSKQNKDTNLKQSFLKINCLRNNEDIKNVLLTFKEHEILYRICSLD